MTTAPPLTLYGSLTSPYVRRIRFLALEWDIPFELFDTSTESGQSVLRSKSATWKVPYIEDGANRIWDSYVIIDYIAHKSGKSYGIPWDNKWEEANTTNAIDTALESAVNFFYLTKDYPDSAKGGYVLKQRTRVTHLLNYLESQLQGSSFGKGNAFGLPELYLYTTLDWMQYRNIIDLQDFPKFPPFLKEHASRKNIEATKPP